MSSPVHIAVGDLAMELWPLGARLNQVTYRGNPCLMASTDRDEALGARKYNGAVVGPVANRIAGGRVEIDGVPYDLPLNENGETTLHGGPDALHAQDWRVADAGSAKATFTLDLPDGALGLPGNRHLQATYRVEDDAFTVTLTATSDAATFINLALHPYWTLGAVDTPLLQVAAETYLPVDGKKIPTGEIAPVAETMFDLRQESRPSTDIDHNFCLTPDKDGPAVRLAAPETELEIFTNAPGVQIYAGKAPAIAIEPQHWPDAPHHAHFPSIRLDPGQAWRQHSTYRFRAR